MGTINPFTFHAAKKFHLEKLNKFAKSKGFDHIQHLINASNLMNGTKHKTFEDISKFELNKLLTSRNA